MTNGTGGTQEIDDGKQFALRGEWVQSAWRAGLSVLHNDTDLGERLIYGVFAGIKTGALIRSGMGIATCVRNITLVS